MNIQILRSAHNGNLSFIHCFKYYARPAKIEERAEPRPYEIGVESQSREFDGQFCRLNRESHIAVKDVGSTV